MKSLNIALLSLASVPVFSQSKPNVLYIMTDEQSYNMMSCYMGNKWLSTPNMDKIANMGYRFDKAYCSNPLSMPSRFSLLTGHYASEVGTRDNTRIDYDAVKQIVSTDALGILFRKAGYETLYSGKTHLYGTKDVSEYGFKLNTLDQYDGPAIYAEKVFAEKGKDKTYKPFFLFLSFVNPHDICTYVTKTLSTTNIHAREPMRLLALQKTLSPEEYSKQIPPHATNTNPITDEQPGMVSLRLGSREWTDDQWNLYSWMYYRLTESADALIGRVLTALEKSGLSKNTIIVFTSDHGDMNGAHGLIHKKVMFEEAQRVPFIIAGKGIKSNYVDKSTLVCNGLDFLPTICDLCGIESPKGISGISLKPYLTGDGKKPNRKFIITEDDNAYQINDGRYKYTIYELPGYPETLTDLHSNPGETINYAKEPSYNGIKMNLKRELMSNLSQRGLTPLAENTIKNTQSKGKSMKSNKKGKSNLKSNDDDE